MKIEADEKTISIYMTKNEAETCHHPGPCDHDCAYMVARHPRLCRRMSRKVLISAFFEYGAWSLADLRAKSDNELHIIALWVAAGDILEGFRGHWALLDGSYGLAHPEYLQDK